MNTKIWRHLQFIFALSYACFLIAGAVPQKWLPRNWRPPAAAFAKFQFENLRVVPGLGVFNFPKDFTPLQPVDLCLDVEIRGRDGKVNMFEDFKCPRAKGVYSFYTDSSRTFFSNLAGTGAAVTFKPGSDSIFVKATAEYFCRKFDGEFAVVRFTTHYQNLVSRALLTTPSLPQMLSCNLLRAAKQIK